MRETLRLIKEEDIHFLYRLANDPEVRKNSFSTSAILWEDHEKWFYNKLKTGDVYIYLIDETPVGQIRFDVKGADARISYTIAAGYRGKGYGTKMLQLAEKYFRQAHPECRQLTAQVKMENPSSQKVFLKNGFLPAYVEFSKMLKNGNGGGGATNPKAIKSDSNDVSCAILYIFLLSLSNFCREVPPAVWRLRKSME